MMLVKLIQEKTKNRVSISLDNGLSFVLYKGELRTYKIKEGQEIDIKSYDEIMTNILPKRAKLRAMNLLKVRPYTEKGLYDKLKDGGYPEEIINVAMDYVKSYHYIDDASYAREYIYTYKDRKNKSKLSADLFRKGISKIIIDAALESELSECGNDYEILQIKNILNKKHYDPENTSYEDKMKLLAGLYRKGYSVDLSKKLLDITSDYR